MLHNSGITRDGGLENGGGSKAKRHAYTSRDYLLHIQTWIKNWTPAYKNFKYSQFRTHDHTEFKYKFYFSFQKVHFYRAF